MKKIFLLYSLARYMGLRWCLFRAWYALKLKSGWLAHRCRAQCWEDVDLARLTTESAAADPEPFLLRRTSGDAPAFFFSSADRDKFSPLFPEWDTEGSPLEEAEAILAGRFRFYSKIEKEAGFPPNWHRNQFTGEEASADFHWSRLPDFGFGDIKNIWELSRFGWAYTLVRAYWRTGDERFPEAFWTLFEDWLTHNQPNLGANWKCGQEISFRLMAWCFAFHSFLRSPATTPGRAASFLKAVALSADRIGANLGYAISQKNNHGISEATGLWTAGLLFPELKGAKGWLRLGEDALERQASELIYDDGSFSQHSMNYHRVMLHDYIWAVRLGQLNGRMFSNGLRKRLGAAVEFLWLCQDEQSGYVPLYGPNDGALILPLSNCDYRDFRPVVAMGRYLFGGKCGGANGPWKESLLWLFGTDALQPGISPGRRPERTITSSGYLVWRGTESWIFSRAGSYRHRPNEADALHIDMWWRGLNIAGDAGTFSYNAPGSLDGAFKRTQVHNTLAVDGEDQMEKAGRFLWLPWLKGEWHVRTCEQLAGGAVEGFHNGYARLPAPAHHRRTILHPAGDIWIIVDRGLSATRREYHLHWLLGDWPLRRISSDTLQMETPRGAYFMTSGGADASAEEGPSVIIGDPGSPRGWRSAYYQHREKASSVRFRQVGKTVTFITVFSPLPVKIIASEAGFELTLERQTICIALDEASSGSVATVRTARATIPET